jgi:hypothetical protein
MPRLGAALIVLTFVFASAGVVDAQSPPPAQQQPGVRVYVPEAHVGLTLPVDWSVSVDYRRADPPPGESMPADARWAVLSAWEGEDATDLCRLFRYEGSGLPLAGFAAELMDPRMDVTVTPVSLDAGEAVRLDLALGEGYLAQQYIVRSDDSFYQLACLADGEAVDDLWLSIAQSIDFRTV